MPPAAIRSRVSSTGPSSVSYTHLDVYKRQAYNYVKVQGVDCTKGRAVYKGALNAFCKMKNDCSFAGSDKNRVYKGNVSYGNWDCTAKRSRKTGNLRCTKSGGRVVYQAYQKN